MQRSRILNTFLIVMVISSFIVSDTQAVVDMNYTTNINPSKYAYRYFSLLANESLFYIEVEFLSGNEVVVLILPSIEMLSYGGQDHDPRSVYEDRFTGSFSIVIDLEPDEPYYIIFYNPMTSIIQIRYRIVAGKYPAVRPPPKWLLPLEISLPTIFFAITIISIVLIILRRKRIQAFRVQLREGREIEEIIEKELMEEPSNLSQFIQRRKQKRSNRLAYKALSLERRNIVNDLQEKALVARNEGNLKEAQDLLTKALEIDSKNYWLKFELAGVLFQQGDHNQAFLIYSELIKQKPKHFETLLNLAKILSLPETYPTADNLKEAITYVKRALNVKPQDKNALTTMANILKYQGDDVQASEILNQIQKLQVQTPLLPIKETRTREQSVSRLLNQAYNALSKNNRKEAEEKFREILLIEEYNQAALTNLGYIFVDTGRWIQAIEVASKAIAKDMFNFEALEVLAHSYRNLKRFKELEAVGKRITLHQANNIRAWIDITISLIGQKRLDDARTTVIKLLNDHPKNAEVWNAYGLVLKYSGQTEEAEKVFKKSEELFSKIVEIRKALELILQP